MHLDQGTHPRLLRKPAIGKIPATTEIKVATSQQRRKGSRFVGPTQLDDDQKVQIRKALDKKKIGDEIGREIFIGALEYQISAFAGQLKRLPAPSEPQGTNTARDKTLSAIAMKATGLSALLRELTDGAKARAIEALAAQDRLGRGYDERYLCELGGEIDRLERACIAAAACPDPAEPALKPEPAPSRELVAKLAGVFSECFEMEPTADEDGAFRAALSVLSQVTGLAIGQEPEFLAQVLSP